MSRFFFFWKFGFTYQRLNFDPFRHFLTLGDLQWPYNHFFQTNVNCFIFTYKLTLFRNFELKWPLDYFFKCENPTVWLKMTPNYKFEPIGPLIWPLIVNLAPNDPIFQIWPQTTIYFKFDPKWPLNSNLTPNDHLF